MAVARLHVVSLAQPALRHGVGGLRRVLEMQPANNEDGSPPTLKATISTPYGSEPRCAVDSVSLLQGPETPFHCPRRLTYTRPDATAVHRKRRDASMDKGHYT
ncbi:hypothetical protein P3342_004603 [Pyrenophora teres f. teres]|nr:hypothetical protein P3342_004603 [Pyrenophora teres f. teres]CAE7020794.1 hypothetical protein PTTW11_03142 [Pyrenophora teres f. teres]